MALDAGSLRVTLHYAKDIKDCDWFGRQDPYVRLRVGSQEKRSRVCRDGGRNPVWDETFEFSVINENTLEMTLMDQDMLMRDDLIGTCYVSLARAREQGHDVVQAPVSSGKKIYTQQGFVQVTLSFMSNSKLRTSSQPALTHIVTPVPAYGYPASAPPSACILPHPQNPGPYGYPPAPAPLYGPSPAGLYQAASFQYSPSFGHTPPPPVPVQAAPAPVPGWPAPSPNYGAPPPAHSYYPQPPVSGPSYGGYYGTTPYRG
ncbi:hypothetical protein Vretimale_5041 [Volvox reticuliferus]|uniref:Uncharacterized protein n=1 Tax=Volvox reticuliferus TaxID=1737510 RepID=A0A8J4DCD5_9CHLO|nr:hypothetical protein Vretifemale_3941 [Volvox reticuliferus]GIM00125.1 hypothetical protein Vretimale_5041 [Volvox reticuliferus]